MTTLSQTLTIKLRSDSHTKAELEALLERSRDPLAVFILNLLNADDVGCELKFEPPHTPE